MIRLSKMADYGIVLLTYVAQLRPGALATARDLAERSGLPMPTVSKVVKTLARGGLLHSHRGVHGGYSLARAASAISVVDVIDAMEGPVAMTACTRTARLRYSLLSTCPTRSAWATVNRRVEEALASMTLDDMRNASASASAPPPSRPTALAAAASPRAAHRSSP